MENDIYSTPESDIEADSNTSPILLYSPTQVAMGTLGGPVALIYFLMSNFDSLGQQQNKKKTLFLGIGLIIALLVIVPFLPANFPSTPFTVIYIIIARQVAEKYQMTKSAIFYSEIYDYHSNWRVLIYGLLCMLGSAIVIMGPLMLLMLTGVWIPEPDAQY